MYIYAEHNFVTFCKANYSVPFDSSLAFKQKIIVIFHATKSVFLPVLEDFFSILFIETDISFGRVFSFLLPIS